MEAPVPAADRVAVKRPRGRPRKTLAEAADGNRRAELLRSAARLFRRQGFDATSTRDIAAAVGMRSGSPFYHFKSKGDLLFAVMEEGMRSAIARQEAVLARADARTGPAALLRVLVRNHFDVLLGPGSDFIPVMLYESRSITPAQRAALVELQATYEACWIPVLHELHAAGELRADVKLARLLIFGALNWSVQWYDRRKGATLDELTDAALALFLAPAASKPRNGRRA
jgi:TetR/AcrR family transcriptional regulator, cholesterol catabolism regulator